MKQCTEGFSCSPKSQSKKEKINSRAKGQTMHRYSPILFYFDIPLTYFDVLNSSILDKYLTGRACVFRINFFTIKSFIEVVVQRSYRNCCANCSCFFKYWWCNITKIWIRSAANLQTERSCQLFLFLWLTLIPDVNVYRMTDTH